MLRCCWSPGAPALPTFSRALVALPPADKALAPANPGSRSAADTALYAVRSLAIGNWLCEMGGHVEASYGTRSGTTDLVRSRMGGGWAGDQMQCCAEFRLTLLWQVHHELCALFPAETTAGTDGDCPNLATAVASRHRSSVVDPYMLTTRTTCTCGACGDVISKYEKALVYDVSLPAVKPGKANEWVSLDECRRFSSSAHEIPEWVCRACLNEVCHRQPPFIASPKTRMAKLVV